MRASSSSLGQVTPVLLLQLLLPLQLLSLTTGQSLKRSVYVKTQAEYRDFLPLTAANLTQLALKDEQAWVIHVHDGFLDPEVKRKAGEVRGLVRFGLVHVNDAEAIDILQKFDPTKHYFRSLPFGWETRKRTKFVDTEGFLEALEHASTSVPDDFVTVVKSELDTKTVLAEAIASKPARFTILFTTKDDQPELLHKVLSRKLVRNYNVAMVPRADTAGALKAAGLAGMTLSVPGMAVLMVSKTGTVRSTRMSEDQQQQTSSSSASTYPEALRFLVEFNRQFRAELPGDARASDRRVLYMSDVLEAERLIFDIEDAAVLDADKSVGEDLKEEL